jgi:hypothetical protein
LACALPGVESPAQSRGRRQQRHGVQGCAGRANAQPEHALNIPQQVEHCCLNGHVESAGQFVQDQQLGLRQGDARKHDAAKLAAGKLVRIAPVDVGF